MLTVVRSPVPSIPLEPGAGPAPVANILSQLARAPHRIRLVVPTARRRRALVRAWLTRTGDSAALLPGLHTLETFVAEALGYSLHQRPTVSGPERLLRLARAWQEVFGRPPGSGLVRQLDGFVRDWQACGVNPPTRPANVFESLVERYLRQLEADGRLDRMSAVRLVTADVADPDSPVCRRFLSRIDAILFDGFHRLERVELDLLAALGERRDVLVYLVGTPGQRSWETLEDAGEYLQARRGRIIDHVPDASSPLAALGRRLFPQEPADVPPEKTPGLFCAETDSAVAEIELTATRIKADYLAASATDQPLRLSDVAVVIPGPEYDPLVREVFDRAGLPFNLAGRALKLATSRPARILTAAVQVIQGQWRYDLLLDFLNLPLVKRQLIKSYRLYDLFEHRPRARQRLTYELWADSWAEHLRRLRQRIAGYRDGSLPLPERVAIPLEEYVERQTELADGLEELIDSIHGVLRPVVALEEALAPASSQPVNGADRMRALVRACVQLLDTLDIADWLTPPNPAGDRCVPWVEYEKDQQAYYKLLDILHTLTTVPADRLPLTADKLPDALAALCLALDAETYQIKTEDDAGVQVFEVREIRGLCFRHVYALGLVDGRVPPPPEEGAVGRQRLRVRSLAEQTRQKEVEATYLFAQLFEAASERLVLMRPRQEGERKALPSPFLAAVGHCAPLEELKAPDLVVNRRGADFRLGRAGAGRRAYGKSLADLWPGVGDRNTAELAAVLRGLSAWQADTGRPKNVHVNAPALLAVLFAERRSFSPSELEVYAACPFRYFGTRVLGLRERETDPTRLDYGSLVHRVFQRFYQERRPRDHQGPLPPLTPAERGRLVALFEEEWQALDDGTLPPDLQTLFRVPNGVLDLFFQTMTAVEAEAGFGNRHVELELRDVPLGKDESGRDVYLSGKIDRVDLRRAALHEAIILDYKTGQVTKPSERKIRIEDGRMLQLPLYGAALSRAHDGLTVIGGAYIHLSERAQGRQESGRAVLAAVGSFLAGGRAAPVPFDIDAARDKAIELAGQIRAGRFSLTLLGDECTGHCATRHACRHPNGYQS
jgi:RecB family exonuclease/superfamily I DNA/RNA helicase